MIGRDRIIALARARLVIADYLALEPPQV